MLTFAIIIMHLDHLYARSCCICDVRHRKATVEGYGYGCVPEHIGVKIKV